MGLALAMNGPALQFRRPFASQQNEMTSLPQKSITKLQNEIFATSEVYFPVLLRTTLLTEPGRNVSPVQEPIPHIIPKTNFS